MAGEGAPDDEGVHLVRLLVRKHRLGVREEAGDLVLEQDAVVADDRGCERDRFAGGTRGLHIGEGGVLVSVRVGPERRIGHERGHVSLRDPAGARRFPS